MTRLEQKLVKSICFHEFSVFASRRFQCLGRNYLVAARIVITAVAMLETSGSLAILWRKPEDLIGSNNLACRVCLSLHRVSCECAHLVSHHPWQAYFLAPPQEVPRARDIGFQCLCDARMWHQQVARIARLESRRLTIRMNTPSAYQSVKAPSGGSAQSAAPGAHTVRM